MLNFFASTLNKETHSHKFFSSDKSTKWNAVHISKMKTESHKKQDTHQSVHNEINLVADQNTWDRLEYRYNYNKLTEKNEGNAIIRDFLVWDTLRYTSVVLWTVNP